MKKKFLILALIFMIFPNASIADDFKVDISLMEAIKKFEILDVGSLAVGEKGLVLIYGLKTCIDGDLLKVASISALDTDPSKHSYDYEVSRSPNNKINVIFSNKGKAPDQEAVQIAVFKVLASPECTELQEENIPLFTVTEFLGQESLRNLVMQSSETIKRNPKNINATSEPKVSERLSNWHIAESKSPIDDSPMVSMFKMTESGNQTLILRCKENRTDAFISTRDYLGKDSTNVTVRYDSGKAQKMNFSLSTNNKALFLNAAIPRAATQNPPSVAT